VSFQKKKKTPPPPPPLFLATRQRRVFLLVSREANFSLRRNGSFSFLFPIPRKRRRPRLSLTPLFLLVGRRTGFSSSCKEEGRGGGSFPPSFPSLRLWIRRIRPKKSPRIYLSLNAKGHLFPPLSPLSRSFFFGERKIKTSPPPFPSSFFSGGRGSLILPVLSSGTL